MQVKQTDRQTDRPRRREAGPDLCCRRRGIRRRRRCPDWEPPARARRCLLNASTWPRRCVACQVLQTQPPSLTIDRQLTAPSNMVWRATEAENCVIALLQLSFILYRVCSLTILIIIFMYAICT